MQTRDGGTRHPASSAPRVGDIPDDRKYQEKGDIANKSVKPGNDEVDLAGDDAILQKVREATMKPSAKAHRIFLFFGTTPN